MNNKFIVNVFLILYFSLVSFAFSEEVKGSFQINVSVKPSCKFYNNSVIVNIFYDNTKSSINFSTIKFNCVKYTRYYLSVPHSVVLTGKNNPDKKVFGKVSISPPVGIDIDGIDPNGNKAYVGVFIPAGQNAPADIYEGTINVSVSY